jgi:hypothetical protein
MSCQHTPLIPVSPNLGFFYWKTSLSLSLSEQELLRHTSAKRLFVKLADIGVNPVTQEVEPYSLLRVQDTTGWSGVEVVPSIFLTNEVFQVCSAAQLDSLATRLMTTIAHLSLQFSPKQQQFTEILIDCDWTAGTQVRFFEWLNVLRRQLPTEKKMSVTLRLHQYRYPNHTGVPPADRVMLMFYNTGDIEVLSAGNTIFDPADAQAYLQNGSSYPIPMDLALPVFQWALIYRDATLWKIWPDPTWAALADTALFKPLSERLFEVKQPTFQGGLLLGAGDQVKLETADSLLLRQIKQMARQLPLATDATVAYYHLEPSLVQRFNAQTSATHFQW